MGFWEAGSTRAPFRSKLCELLDYGVEGIIKCVSKVIDFVTCLDLEIRKLEFHAGVCSSSSSFPRQGSFVLPVRVLPPNWGPCDCVNVSQ